MKYPRSLAVLGVLAAMLFVAAMPTAAAAKSPINQRMANLLDIPEPANDPFYAPPANLEQYQPGTILRQRTVSINTYLIPADLLVLGPIDARQLLVRSTDARGHAVSIVTTVLNRRYKGVIWLPYTFLLPRPLASYQIATDSLGDQCNPSFTLRNGIGSVDDFEDIEKDATGVFVPLYTDMVSVITDYEGPRNAWSAGAMAGHAVLDGIRAALKVPGTGLNAHSPVGGWGYSGGGHATAWAAELQGSYAPELNAKGWAAGDFFAEPAGILKHIDGGPFAGFGLAAAVGISREYPELKDLLNDRGRAYAENIKDDCQITLVLKGVGKKISDHTNRDVYTDPVALAVFDANTIGHAAPKAPVLLQTSYVDEIVPAAQGEFAKQKWCEKGANLTWERSLVPEHIIYALTSNTTSTPWLVARLYGLGSPLDALRVC